MDIAAQKNEQLIEAGLTMTRGSRVAKVSKINDTYTVYVAFQGTACPGEELIPARHFKGYSTCSQNFKTANNAIRAANKFLGSIL